mgnify:CR=1 FL=1
MVDDYADFVNISPEQIIPTHEVEKAKQKEEELEAQKQTMEPLKHECGVAIVRLLKPLEYYQENAL